VPQDYAKAAAWYRRRPLSKGDDLAQKRLGNLYALGKGVPQDFAETYFWLDLAAAGPLAELAAKDRDEAASHLTPADLSREQERARKWFEDHKAKPQRW
jgi:hypothetical protein